MAHEPRHQLHQGGRGGERRRRTERDPCCPDEDASCSAVRVAFAVVYQAVVAAAAVRVEAVRRFHGDLLPVQVEGAGRAGVHRKPALQLPGRRGGLLPAAAPQHVRPHGHGGGRRHQTLPGESTHTPGDAALCHDTIIWNNVKNVASKCNKTSLKLHYVITQYVIKSLSVFYAHL